MDITRHRLLCGIVAVLLFFSSCFGNFNEEFAQGSFDLYSLSPSLHETSYSKTIENFLFIRDRIFSSTLRNRIAQSSLAEKRHFFDPYHECIIKKRGNNNINECYVWEASLLLGSTTAIVPSFPIEIEGKRVVIQNVEKFVVGEWLAPPTLPYQKKVSLTDYWKTHLLAFLLGLADLSGPNVGISPAGKICLFDNEDIWLQAGQPMRKKRGFFLPFFSTAFDWPHYYRPLASFADEINKYIKMIYEKREELALYFQFRGLKYWSAPILERIEILSTFTALETTTFLDFYSYLYPKMAVGLDELASLVSGIIHKRVGHGFALFWTCSFLRFWDLSALHQNSLEDWISRYID